MKAIRSEAYNYNFDYATGFFARWGKSLEDNPSFSPLGPELLDVELTTICSGPDGTPCSFCYKSNTPSGKWVQESKYLDTKKYSNKNMSLELFKKIFHKISTNLTQIAFGVDASCTSNPEVWDIFDYCRNNSYNRVVPNVTVSNISEETAKRLAKVCGAVAVSRYANKDWCYDSVKRLSDYGLKQVNIHALVCEEFYSQVMETLEDIKSDERLKDLNAIVFLSLKKKGRGHQFTPLAFDKFKSLIDESFSLGINFGFDSCGAPKFLQAIEGRKDFKRLESYCEPCESFGGNFSAYIDVHGLYYPCSFCEGTPDFIGMDVAECDDFLEDIWYSPIVKSRREFMVDRFEKVNFTCPVFEV